MRPSFAVRHRKAEEKAEDSVPIIDSTDEFVEAMKEKGADITYMRFEDGTHGVMGQKTRETMLPDRQTAAAVALTPWPVQPLE